VTSGSPFQREVNRRVDAYLAADSARRELRLGVPLKTAAVLAWFAGSYMALLLLPLPPLAVGALAISLGLAAAGIGFDIQHEANHGSLTASPFANAALSFTLDLLGGSSYVWRHKHNVLHHSQPNVIGFDSDLDVSPFARFAPGQDRLRGHRFQHLYVWFLYALLPVKWQFVDDFRDLATGRVGEQPLPAPRRAVLAAAITGKIFFLVWSLAIPLWLHPVWAVAVVFALASATLGVVLAVVFQLAHCVPGADFVGQAAIADRDWATHQVAATLDFARGNRALCWYLGGLNFQIEHHLFPKVSHVHYPAIAPIVESTCRDMGVAYRSHPTFFAALASHVRWLRELGRAAA
jgi:linoleoyl-CoA desaturase